MPNRQHWEFISNVWPQISHLAGDLTDTSISKRFDLKFLRKSGKNRSFRVASDFVRVQSIRHKLSLGCFSATRNGSGWNLFTKYESPWNFVYRKLNDILYNLWIYTLLGEYFWKPGCRMFDIDFRCQDRWFKRNRGYIHKHQSRICMLRPLNGLKF